MSFITSETDKNLLYLADSISHYYTGEPVISIREAFKIFENEKNPQHNKFKALRNIFSHDMPFKKDTLNMFEQEFNKDDFDYIQYDIAKGILIIDLKSHKTLKKLNGLSLELRNYCKGKLKL